MSLDEEELIKSRLLLFESRPFNRITKRKDTLLQLPVTHASAVAATAPAGGAARSQPNTTVSFAQHHADIDLDFDYFQLVISRIQLLINTNTREIARYAAEKAAITSTAEEARRTLSNLRVLLAESQDEKQNRLEYDLIAFDVLEVSNLKPREEQYENLARLNAEIEALEKERDDYSQVWAARRSQFEQIVMQLELMWQQIKEDKDEQDRREGMNEEEEGEELGASPTPQPPGVTCAVESMKTIGGERTPTPVLLAVPMRDERSISPNVTAISPIDDDKEEGEEIEDDDVVEITMEDTKKVVAIDDRMDMSA